MDRFNSDELSDIEAEVRMLTRQGLEKPYLLFGYKLERAFIRSLRIGAVIAIGLVAQAIHEGLPPVWDRPVALLTLSDIAKTALFWLVATAAIGPLMELGFGPGPGRDGEVKFISERARARVIKERVERREVDAARAMHPRAVELGRRIGRFLSRR
jgi:hypothetical protein